MQGVNAVLPSMYQRVPAFLAHVTAVAALVRQSNIATAVRCVCVSLLVACKYVRKRKQPWSRLSQAEEDAR